MLKVWYKTLSYTCQVFLQCVCVCVGVRGCVFGLVSFELPCVNPQQEDGEWTGWEGRRRNTVPVVWAVCLSMSEPLGFRSIADQNAAWKASQSWKIQESAFLRNISSLVKRRGPVLSWASLITGRSSRLSHRHANAAFLDIYGPPSWRGFFSATVLHLPHASRPSSTGFLHPIICFYLFCPLMDSIALRCSSGALCCQ